MQCNLAKTMKISLLMSCLALFGCSNDSEVADKIKASHRELLRIFMIMWSFSKIKQLKMAFQQKL